MEAMRDAWTDDRMDDLAARVDRGFAQADARMDRFENRIEASFEKLNESFDRQWRLLLATYLTTLVGLFTAHF